MTTPRRGARSWIASSAIAALCGGVFVVLFHGASQHEAALQDARVEFTAPMQAQPAASTPSARESSSLDRASQPAPSRAELAINQSPEHAIESAATAPHTWWSETLGIDVDDPSVVVNSDDRIFDAMMAGLLARSDVRVLEDWIALNQLDEGSSPYDFDDGDGTLSWWEFGFQVWKDGRLVAFSLGPDPHTSFGYGVEALPESVADLDGLRYLGLQNNRLSELPEGIGRLTQLEQLVASQNRLTTVPVSMDGMTSLARLILTDNLLEGLPPTIGSLDALRALYLAGNPLTTLPDELGRLSNLQVLDLSRSNASGSDSLVLPETLGDLPNLHEMYLAGHPLPCGGGGAGGNQFKLRDGSIVQVFGASSGSCGQ